MTPKNWLLVVLERTAYTEDSVREDTCGKKIGRQSVTKRMDKEGKMDGEGRGGPRTARRAHLCILKAHNRFSESSVLLVNSTDDRAPKSSCGTKIIMWHQNHAESYPCTRKTTFYSPYSCLLYGLLIHISLLQSFIYISRCFRGKRLFWVQFAALKPENTQVVLYPF